MRLRNQSGTSVVEFAIVLPLLLILIFGIVEFSILFYDKAMLTNASREGARAGIVFSVPKITIPQIQSVVNNYCQSYLITFGSTPNLTTVVTPDPTTLVSGDPLTVTVTYNYSFLVLPNFITFLINPIPLSAITVMRME